MTDTNKVIEELQSASKWFADHGRNTNTAIIGICDRAVDEINRQRAEIEQYMDYNDKLIESFDEQKAEIERLEIELKATRGTANSLKMHYDLAVAERDANVKGFTESIATVKAEAVKKFAERLKTEMIKSRYGLTVSPYSRACNAVIDFWVNELDQIAKEMVGEQG